jgi:hypothetical protein
VRCSARGISRVARRREDSGKTTEGRWSGKTAVIAASGPSLCADDVAYAHERGAVILAVNNAYQIAPAAAALYACDAAWWSEHIASVRANFAGELWTQSRPAAEAHALNWIRSADERGLSGNPAVIYGNNSGHQAVNLAVHWGTRRIILLGFNMGKVAGATHFHGEHPATLRNPGNATMARWAREFEPAAEDARRIGAEIINCTTKSNLHCFPFADLREAL